MSEHKADFYTEVFNQGYQAGLSKALLKELEAQDER